MRWTTLFIVACSLLAADATGHAATARAKPDHRALRDTSCVRCHTPQRAVLTGAMAVREGERAFAHRAFGRRDGDAFFAGSCGGCHVKACSDCHGAGAAFAARPDDEACMKCHRGYYVGWDYHGRAEREDHERYQRGATANGGRVLQMTPDVHQQRGMKCISCHTVHTLHGARGKVKGCAECHTKISKSVPEHAITAHLDKMECWTCHSAWASQEYGTFLVRARSAEQQMAFSALPSWGEWKKSAYLRRQDAPPIGLNARGKASPIRPMYLLFATDRGKGWENRPLAAEWRAFVPHTTRRGTTTCSGCHDSPRRFLLENDADRIHRPDEDGLPMRSFWNRKGQSVANGAFFPADRHKAMNRKSPEYVREHLKQWQEILKHVAPSSSR